MNAIQTARVETGALLSVRDLRVTFGSTRGALTAVDGVDLDVRPGEVLGIAGESGSGKSVTLRAILGLIHAPGLVDGQVFWRGRDLRTLPQRQLRKVRGGEIGIIFQEPMTALNPVLTVGMQILENLKEHTQLDAAGRRKRATELLDLVGIPAAQSRLNDYPHQFSGGMRQRAMIAIALASNPKLLLADEPTTALDVTIQDQILKLILRLRSEMNMSVVLVTHDLGVIAQTCDRLAVMYAGRVVETGPVTALFKEPRHAYTLGLLNSVPRADLARQPLSSISGQPPLLFQLPPGCAFAPRCRFMTQGCTEAKPPLVEVATDHRSACIHHDKVAQAKP
ncbi:MAG TPA: ABC transporter ATP-binding protein [Dongiaceae bacterium]|nr:ABC transporter ATP-binding protein [Dongiaceae bacterium]